MKKKKKSFVLVKRIFFSKGTYDYLWKDKKEAEDIIKSTRNKNNRDFQFVRAEKRIEIWFRIKKFFDNKNIQKLIWLLIGMLITVLGNLVFNI